MKAITIVLLITFCVGLSLSIIVPHQWLRDTYNSPEYQRLQRQISSLEQRSAPWKHNNHRSRETIESVMCNLGGGASGMGTAAYVAELLKQQRQSQATTSPAPGSKPKPSPTKRDVVVLEVEDFLGGNCNTYRFTDPVNGTIDIGVAALPNTTLAKLRGETFWGDFDSVAEINKWTNGKVFPIVQGGGGSSPTYNYNFATGASTEPFPVYNQTAVGIALTRLNGLLDTYEWMASSDRPSPIPEELLVPFDQFIIDNGLEPLVPFFFPPLAPFPDYSDMLAVYGLIAFKKTLIWIFTESNAGFVIRGGCVQIYEGMEQVIGEQNIFTEVEYLKVKRSEPGSRKPHEIKVRIGKGRDSYVQDFKCDYLVVAYPTTKESTKILKPDNREKAAHGQAEGRFWGSLALKVGGPLGSSSNGFTINNFDTERQFGKPAIPYLAPFARRLPFGPVTSYINAGNNQITEIEAYEIVEEQLENMPDSLITNYTVLEYIPHYNYQPHLPAHLLRKQVNPYKLQRVLDAELYRKTVWRNTGTYDGDNDHALQLFRARQLARRMVGLGIFSSPC